MPWIPRGIITALLTSFHPDGALDRTLQEELAAPRGPVGQGAPA
jgi:hypothetical protein